MLGQIMRVRLIHNLIKGLYANVLQNIIIKLTSFLICSCSFLRWLVNYCACIQTYAGEDGLWVKSI